MPANLQQSGVTGVNSATAMPIKLHEDAAVAANTLTHPHHHLPSSPDELHLKMPPPER